MFNLFDLLNLSQGLDPKKMGAEVNWENVVTEPEHLLELKAYCCENCGYTLFPARGDKHHEFDMVVGGRWSVVMGF